MIVCIGLLNKKDTVKNLMILNKNDVICQQEVETNANVPDNELTIGSYNSEIRQEKQFMFMSKLHYRRRQDLEGTNNGLVIINLDTEKLYRIMSFCKLLSCCLVKVTAKTYFYLWV